MLFCLQFRFRPSFCQFGSPNTASKAVLPPVLPIATLRRMDLKQQSHSLRANFRLFREMKLTTTFGGQLPRRMATKSRTTSAKCSAVAWFKRPLCR
ncbi:MAG: hypothetical protein ACTS6G_03295 [Candidatus Hodgkinia cicadicola]